jgi:aliphatic nitrilase
MEDSSILAARSLAYQLKAFVISSCAIVTDELIEAYDPAPKDREQLARLKDVGGTCIVGPRGKLVAGPMGPGEGILYCDVNTEDVIVPKLIHDFAGHYNRFDLFSVAIATDDRRGRRQLSGTPGTDQGWLGPSRPSALPDNSGGYYLEGPGLPGDDNA